MHGARSSGVTGTPWPRFTPVFTGATALWRRAVTAMWRRRVPYPAA